MSVVYHNIVTVLNIHGQEMMLVLPNQRLSREFAKSALSFLLCLPLIPFPNRVPIERSEIAFSLVVLSEGDRTDFSQEERLGVSYWTMSLAIRALVDIDESKCLDIPIWEFSIIFEHLPFLPGYKADTASASCPAHPGSLLLMSMTFATVIRDADDPGSVDTAYEPESSLTISHRSTTRPLYFWCVASNSEFFK